MRRKDQTPKTVSEVLDVLSKLSRPRSAIELAIEQNKAAFVEKLTDGVSVKTMAEALGVSVRTLQILFTRYGVKKAKEAKNGHDTTL